MKTKLIYALLLVIMISTFSCSKTKVNTVTTTVDTTVNLIDTPSETPMKSLFANGGIVDSLFIGGASPYELGSQFYTSSNGTISKLGCICPTKNIPYQVSLWDVTSTNIIATVTVTPTDSLHFFYANIAPLNITANTPYMISVNTSSGGNAFPYYLIINQTFTGLAFPFSAGSAVFINSFFATSTTTVYPGTSESDYMAPADFVFKAD
jgi:Domain of unknown function (DUF4082)